MDGKRYYRVADFGFSIESKQWDTSEWENYAPFVSEAFEDVIFNLKIDDVDLSHEPLEHIVDSVSDEDMPRVEIYRVLQGDYAGGWLLKLAMWRDSPICSLLAMTSDFKEAALQMLTDNVRFSVDNATMLLFAFATNSLKALEMHASVIKKGGKGYVFLGKSGTGKSTHAQQWLQAFPDAKLLNDDNPVLRLMPNGTINIYGSPWSGKTSCYVNESAEVALIVQLEQAPCNELFSLSMPEAYSCMLSSVSGLKIDAQVMDFLYATIVEIITTLPIKKLRCLPNVDAARCCYAYAQSHEL